MELSVTRKCIGFIFLFNQHKPIMARTERPTLHNLRSYLVIDMNNVVTLTLLLLHRKCMLDKPVQVKYLSEHGPSTRPVMWVL